MAKKQRYVPLGISAIKRAAAVLSMACLSVSLLTGCGRNEKNTSETDSCKIILVGMPKGGAKDLLRIKKIFNCNMPMREMLLEARNNTLVIDENITVSRAKVLIKKLEDIAEFIQIKK